MAIRQGRAFAYVHWAGAAEHGTHVLEQAIALHAAPLRTVAESVRGHPLGRKRGVGKIEQSQPKSLRSIGGSHAASTQFAGGITGSPAWAKAWRRQNRTVPA